MFLTDAELVELTAYRQPSKQVAQLRRMGIPFHINAAGHPKVARAVLEGGKQTDSKRIATWSPSWADTRA